MSDLSLAITVEAMPDLAALPIEVPLASEADFRRDNCLSVFGALRSSEPDSLVYYNAATCPDCGGSMIRQGRCGVCPSCGLESCLL